MALAPGPGEDSSEAPGQSSLQPDLQESEGDSIFDDPAAPEGSPGEPDESKTDQPGESGFEESSPDESGGSDPGESDPGEPGEPGEPDRPGEAGPGEPEESASPDAPANPFRFFSASSFWNEATAPDATPDPSSAALVGALASVIAAEQQTKEGPWINTTDYSVPIYEVPAGQPAVKVTLENASREPALQAAWTAVPLPSNAHPATGSDGELVVWQPSTGRLWEFWRLTHGPEGWRASWGGAIQNESANSGAYGADAWPGAESWWGASASSLSLAGGLITLEDLKRGQIDHALALAVPNVRAGVYASPARRSDGKSSNPLSLPEGAHLRLNPSLDLQALHLPRLTMMIAQAAQRYGIYVRDGSHNVQLYAQDPSTLASNPYLGSGGYFEGRYPTQLLASFPWSQLQVLKMELHNAK
ncbi:MAG TPA: hypothetical protein VK781_12015 [Solirubrobacteraceae bacterium]|nr:hypothetical protein [Solirubrobacteraceae bacterium]